GLENEPERGGRCLECFKLRLLDAARYALSNGFTLLTTTLASSRWKSLDQINQAGLWAVSTALSEAGAEGTPSAGTPPPLQWWDKNWRKGGLQERRGQIIKERNFYNQLYCGCEYSIRPQF
ncbi:MAG: epoxyqueuosine reductase QueH, partial [Bacteroidales bacterium]|nr:epoxyqueuosine reductase QueH [Bacteroidales bacterium]